MKHAADLIPLFLSDQVCQHRIRPYGKSYDQIHKNTDQRYTASYCRKGVIPCKSPHYRHIRRVKELLKDTAEC